MKRLLCSIMMMGIVSLACRADVYFIRFTDKADSTYIALSDKALARRATHSIAIDSLDYAVCPAYLDSLRAHGAEVLHTSRWMNGATIKASDTTRLRQLSFVQAIELTRIDASTASPKQPKKTFFAEYQSSQIVYSDTQLQLTNLDTLRRLGYTGEGITIAVLDGGFAYVDTLSCFRHLYDEGRMLGCYDRTDDQWSMLRFSPFRTGSHGTFVLSCMAAESEQLHGAASGASYVLIRTEEEMTEGPKELDNYISGVELADSLGADIITTSLGYFGFDDTTHFPCKYAMMDGHYHRASRAATIAARKGLLVCNAMGNEGNKAFHYLSMPADADSIVSVGAIDAKGAPCAFSSYGPTADGRIKPEVVNMGATVQAYDPSGQLTAVNGTSFATPLTAGLLATVWSAMPEKSNMQMRDLLIRSASQYLTPTHPQMGYGIPDAYFMLFGKTTACPAIAAHDSNSSTRYYTLQGLLLHERPARGCYIVVSGGVAKIQIAQ